MPLSAGADADPGVLAVAAVTLRVEGAAFARVPALAQGYAAYRQLYTVARAAPVVRRTTELLIRGAAIAALRNEDLPFPLARAGRAVRLPSRHVRGAEHVPHVASQPSSPQVLIPHSGTQTQFPLWHASLLAHVPHEPPHPSGPQVRSKQFAIQPGGGGGGDEGQAPSVAPSASEAFFFLLATAIVCPLRQRVTFFLFLRFLAATSRTPRARRLPRADPARTHSAPRRVGARTRVRRR